MRSRLLPCRLLAWGRDGHTMVTKLAMRMLSDVAREGGTGPEWHDSSRGWQLDGRGTITATIAGYCTLTLCEH